MAAACRADTGLVHIVHAHDNTRHQRRVQENVTVEQILGFAVQPADDVTAQRPPRHAAHVFRAPALAAAIQRGDGVSTRHIAQLVGPVARTARIAVEHTHRRVWAVHVLGAQQLSINPRPTCAGEVHVKTLGKGRLKLRRDQLHLRVERVEFGQCSIPIGVEVCRARIASFVGR